MRSVSLMETDANPTETAVQPESAHRSSHKSARIAAVELITRGERDRLAKHRGAAGQAGGDEFRHGDKQITAEGGIATPTLDC